MGVLGGITEGAGAGSGGGGTGDVNGPGSSTDKAVATFSGTDGEQLLDNPGVTIPASGTLQAATFRGSASASGTVTLQSTSNATKGAATVDASQALNPTGTAALPGISFTSDPGSGIYPRSAGRLTASISGAATAEVSATKLLVNDGVGIGFSANTVDAADGDVYWSRSAAGVMKACKSIGVAADAYIQWGGQSFLAADFTNATTTMAATGLSVPVTSGRKYVFRAIIKASNSTPADGLKLDFDGGTATATNFWSVFRINDVGSESLQGGVSALASDITLGSFDGSADTGWVEFSGSFEPSSSGTFAIRAALVVHTTGTLTVRRGSHLIVHDIT
jgi:hypothetical protein